MRASELLQPKKKYNHKGTRAYEISPEQREILRANIRKARRIAAVPLDKLFADLANPEKSYKHQRIVKELERRLLYVGATYTMKDGTKITPVFISSGVLTDADKRYRYIEDIDWLAMQPEAERIDKRLQKAKAEAEAEEAAKAERQRKTRERVEEARRQAEAEEEQKREEIHARQRAYYAAHAERKRAINAKWLAAHRDEQNAKARARRAANPEKYRARDRARRTGANHAKFRAQANARYAARLDEWHEYQRKYREAHKEEINARKRAYYARHAESIRVKGRARYAAKKCKIIN